MYLHEERDLFRKIIISASEQLGIVPQMVEKDYYVTMILRLLSDSYNNVVFKGGTSLSKAYNIISRFSEDIDVTFTEHIGGSRRKKLKNDVILGISRTMSVPIANWSETQSDRDVNSYVFDYESLFSPDAKISGGVKLETALGSHAFPVVEMKIENYINTYLSEAGEVDLIEKFVLNPFEMKVQSLERTFIDKIFALCDYYLQGKSRRLSRHLYDIFKIEPHVTIDDSFQQLVKDVRNHRRGMAVCPSAEPAVDIPGLICSICDSDFYKDDYEKITQYFAWDSVAYEEAKKCLLNLSTRVSF